MRFTIGDAEKTVIDAVWEHYQRDGEWIPRALLYHRLDKNRPIVDTAVKNLGGTVVYETWADNGSRFALTFVGILLSSQGKELESLLEKYLSVLTAKFEREPRFQEIRGEEVEKELELTQAESNSLRVLIDRGHIWGHSAALGSGSAWYAGPQEDIHELRHESDLKGYIHRKAMEPYCKSVPVGEAARLTALLREQASLRELGVNNSSFLGHLQHNWHKYVIALVVTIIGGVVVAVLQRAME